MNALDNLLTALQLKLPTATEQEKNLYYQLRQARQSLPEALVHDLVNRINDLLPKAAEKNGTHSETYKFYVDLLIMCFWAHRYKGIADDAQLTMQNLRMENTILRERLAETERRLQRYESAEEMVLSGTLDMYLKKVLGNIGAVMPDHPRVKAFAQALETIETTNKPPTP